MLMHSYSNFTILFTPRTGSSYLTVSLSQHPIVNKVYDETWVKRRLSSNRPIVCKEHLGLAVTKTPITEIFAAGRQKEIAKPIIVTYRNNKLSQAISFRLAQRDGFSKVHYKGDIEIDIKHARKLIRDWSGAERKVRETMDCLWLEYGEIVNGSGVRKAQEFIGLQPKPHKVFTMKQSEGINSKYVRNIEELKASDLAGWL